MTLTSKLDNILAQCREVLALADKATPGPWRGIHGDTYCAYPSVGAGNGHHFILFDRSDEEGRRADDDVKFPGLDSDADFIATSRTLTPRLARATITAIEALRTIAWIKDSDDALVPKRDGSFLGTTAFNALQRIADEWEEKP